MPNKISVTWITVSPLNCEERKFRILRGFVWLRIATSGVFL
jgi:hypothetical protein